MAASSFVFTPFNIEIEEERGGGMRLTAQRFHPLYQPANHDGQSEQGFGSDAEVVIQRMQSATPVPVGQSEKWHDRLNSAKSSHT